jgi:hypothetical protein
MSRSLSLPFLLVSPLLTIALGVWVLVSALQMTVGTPQQTEDLLNKSGIYQAVIPSQVAEVQAANPSLQNLPLDNPQIQKILGRSLDSQNLQKQGNQAVDAIYAWLEGKTAKPQIDIAVQANPQELAKAAGDYAFEFASKLPACAPGEADYSTLQSDPLSAKCLPAGVDAAMVRSSVEDTVANNPALGTSTQLTENDVKFNNGKTIMDSFNTAPTWYQRAQKLPLWSAIAAAIFVLLLLLILRPIGGIKSVGKHLLSVGIVLALAAIGLTWVFKKLYDTFIPKSDNPNIADALNSLSNLFNAAYRDNIVRLSIILAVAGLTLVVVAVILKRLQRASKPAPSKVASSARPVLPASEPESLAKAPAASSFTPLGPPKLPSAPVAAGKHAKATKKTAKTKPSAKTAAKKKPAARRKKK